MSLISHGVDLVECKRIENVLAKHEDRFLQRVLTPGERERARRFRHPVPHIAGRFAAKEAVLKVLGTGWRGQIAWTDIEITNDKWGRPVVTLSGQCARRAQELGITSVLMSITHTDSHAMASAIATGN